MSLYPGDTIAIVWATFVLVWLVSSFRVNRTVQAEGRAGIARRLLLGFVAYVLLFRGRYPRLGLLNERFVPDNPWIAWLGAVITAVGVGFAIWARIHIGRYWSGNVVLKEGHQLIRSGPYARIRHPIYTGILGALAGSALAFGRISGLLAFAIYLVSFWFKARKEEALLAGRFGAAFEEHRRQTGFWLPRFSPPAGPH